MEGKNEYIFWINICIKIIHRYIEKKYRKLITKSKVYQNQKVAVLFNVGVFLLINKKI